jgi:hypothetical protein
MSWRARIAAALMGTKEPESSIEDRREEEPFLHYGSQLSASNKQNRWDYAFDQVPPMAPNQLPEENEMSRKLGTRGNKVGR